MSSTIYLEPKPEIIELSRKAFPDYKGKRFEFQVYEVQADGLSEPVEFANNYWDGGTRSYYVILEMVTGKRRDIPTAHPFFEKAIAEKLSPGYRMPEGVVVVEHSYFGNHQSVIIHIRKDNVTPMLPKPVELSWAEKVVLTATASLKNSYGGRTNIRFTEAQHDTGITIEEWNDAYSKCIAKGFLKGNGSITPAGRNAVPGFHDLYSLKREKQA